MANVLPEGDTPICQASRGDVVRTLDGTVDVAVVDYFDSRARALRVTLLNIGRDPWSWHAERGLRLQSCTLPIPAALRSRMPDVKLGTVLTVWRKK